MRRQRLLTNLLKVVERVQSGVLPRRITEIRAFGSFLRLKEEPGDVDLAIFYQPQSDYDEKVELFRKLVLEGRKTKEGQQGIETLISHPELIQKLEPGLSGLPIASWLPYIRAKGWEKTYFQFLFDPNEVTKAILKEGLHGIQVAEVASIQDREQVLARMSSKEFRLVWSPQNPDLEANIAAIASPEEQAKATLSELENFLVQAEQYSALYGVLKEVAIWAQNQTTDRDYSTDEKHIETMLNDVASKRGVTEQYRPWVLSKILDRTWAEDPTPRERITLLDIEQSLMTARDSTPDELGGKCEELRQQIRRLREKCAVLRVFIRQLINPSTEYSVMGNRTENAALRALSWVPGYEASEEAKRSVLEDIGLNEISRRIVLVPQLGTKAEYSLGKTEEELSKLLESQETRQIEKTYSSYLRPLLRRAFPPSVDAVVSIKTQRDPVGHLIPAVIELYVRQEHGDSEAFLQAERTLGFQTGNYAGSGRDYATLVVDVSAFKGDRKSIVALIRKKLGLERERPLRRVT